MEFKKCFECVLCKKFEPGITLGGEKIGYYTLFCMATGEQLEITDCVKENRFAGLTTEDITNLP